MNALVGAALNLGDFSTSVQEVSVISSSKTGGQIVANTSRQRSKFQKFGGHRKLTNVELVTSRKGVFPRRSRNPEGRARYYDPAIGRFLQKDPDPGKASQPVTMVNANIYALNSPSNASDPTGRFSVTAVLGGIGDFISKAFSSIVAVVSTVVSNYSSAMASGQGFGKAFLSAVFGAVVSIAAIALAGVAIATFGPIGALFSPFIAGTGAFINNVFNQWAFNGNVDLSRAWMAAGQAFSLDLSVLAIAAVLPGALPFAIAGAGFAAAPCVDNGIGPSTPETSVCASVTFGL